MCMSQVRHHCIIVLFCLSRSFTHPIILPVYTPPDPRPKQDVVGAKFRPMPETNPRLNAVCPNNFFSQPWPPPSSRLYLNPFLLSFTCYLQARNSPAAERLRPGQSFPGHQSYLLCSALLEASCAWGRRGRAQGVCAGRECFGVSTRWRRGGTWKCVYLCDCVREELGMGWWRLMLRSRGGTMSAPLCSSLSCGWRGRGGGGTLSDSAVQGQRCRAHGQGHRAGYCLANRTLGDHQSLRSSCSLSIRLGLRLVQTLPPSPSPRLRIKREKGSPQFTSPRGTFVQMFRDLLSLNNTLQ